MALWVFLAFSTLYAGLSRGHFIGTDEVAIYQATRSLWEDRDLHTETINNTFVGRGGLRYSQYSAGQSVAALPLYGLGAWIGQLLERNGLYDWVGVFAWPTLGMEPTQWGGTTGIFFVNLFNAFTTALTCAVFFAFSVRLGGSVRGSLISTALLGLTTYVGPFSTTFLQHPSEALLVLWSCYFLFVDAQRPDWRSRAWAGTLLGLAFVFRFQAFVAAPALGLYLGWSVWERSGRRLGALPRGGLRELPAFVLPVLAGAAVHFAVNYVKFESIWGRYSGVEFANPFETGLYGLLFSPGASVFIFTPLLLLLPWTFAHFARTRRNECVLIVTLGACYLLFYGSYVYWHGLWSGLGPRYLMPMVPLLLLPLTGWMEARGSRAWLAVAPLAVAGAWVQFVHVAVNFSYIAYFERYPNLSWPPASLDFMFSLERSPIVAHSRATLAWDGRVDLWLLNVYRMFGTERVLQLLVPLLCVLAICLWGLWRAARAAQPGAVVPRDAEATT